jgi:hypothetical protein
MVPEAFKIHIADICKQGVLSEILLEIFNEKSLRCIVARLVFEVFLVFVNQLFQCGFVFLLHVEITLLCYQSHPFANLTIYVFLFFKGLAYPLTGRIKAWPCL